VWTAVLQKLCYLGHIKNLDAAAVADRMMMMMMMMKYYFSTACITYKTGSLWSEKLHWHALNQTSSTIPHL